MTESGGEGAELIRARQLLTFDSPAGVGLIEDAAVLSRGGRVSWCGPWRERPGGGLATKTAEVVTPAWLDCHTHALFAGTRHADFARRNAGESYATILEAGGGISSTVAASRAAGDEELFDSLLARLRRFWEAGVSVVEVKSGYGLDYAQELRHLRTIRRAAAAAPGRVVVTCLAAHTVPAEWAADRAGYVDMIVDRLLPEVAAEGLADQVDVFCDRGAFSVEESRRVLERARSLGFALRVHAEELANTGAAMLAAELGARSADHLEHIGEQEIRAMAAADVAAVLLPLVTVFLDLPERAPARALAAAGVRIAVSTDFNPGSANSADLQLALSLACSLHKLTPAEALRGVTRVPAEILGVDGEYGVVRPGARADLLEFEVTDWTEIPYHMGATLARRL